MSKENIDLRINNSVRWLNAVDPNWLDKIDTRYLCMTQNCILDQVFGNFEDVLEIYPQLKDKNDGKLYMFTGHTLEWKEKIKELRSDLIPG